MADSRPRGIEKIAHLFIAGNGAANVRARDNSPLRWSGPATPGKGNGDGQGRGEGAGVREAAGQGQPSAESTSEAPADASKDASLRAPAAPCASAGDPKAEAAAQRRRP